MLLRYFMVSAGPLMPAFCLMMMLSACQQRSEQTPLLTSLDKTITQSTLNARREMEYQTASLSEKMQDPCSEQKAERWLPVAKRAEHLTIELSDYLLQQKQEIAEQDSKATARLYDTVLRRVLRYRTDILALHERVSAEFASQFDGLEKTDSKETELSSQLQLLKNSARSELPIALTQIRHTIMQMGTGITAVCGEQVNCITESFDTFSTIIGQSSKILLPGQTLEIFAGVGAFSKVSMPKIFIDDKPCTLREDGTARYPLVISSKTGQYSVPVRIEFTDQNGIARTINNEIFYEVFKK